MEEGNASFEYGEKVVRLPPYEVGEARGKRLAAGDGRQPDGQRGLVDAVGEIAEVTAVTKLLERSVKECAAA